jgi:hypothetical protein
MRTRRPARTALRFHRWLVAQPSGAVVGTRRRLCDCPLARWLREDLGGDGVFVDARCWTVAVDEPCRVMPTWARRFVHLIDDVNWYGTAVTLEEAYTAMTHVLAERHDREVTS